MLQVTSPGRRRPSRKKSPAPLPPGFISPGSGDPSTTGEPRRLGRSDRSVRRSGSLDNILCNFGDDSESPVPPPRIKRRQRIGLADIRGGKKSGSDSASASGSESPDRGRYAYRKQGLGNVVAAASHDKYDLATEPSYLNNTAVGNYDFALSNNNNNISSSLHTSYLEKLAEMEQKKLELERLRRKYTGRMTGSGSSDLLHSNAYLDVGVGEGDEASLHEDIPIEYQNVEFNQPFSHTSTTFSTNIGAHGYPSTHSEDNVKTVLRFDKEQEDSNHFTDTRQTSSPERDSFSRIKETSLSPERSHLTRFKDAPSSSTKQNAKNNASKVVLNFNEDQDDSQSYEDVILLNKKKIGDDEPIPQTFIDGREEVDTWAQSVDARIRERTGGQADARVRDGTGVRAEASASALARESQAAGASSPPKTNRFSLHLDTSTQLYQPGVDVSPRSGPSAPDQPYKPGLDVSPRSGMTAEEEYTMSNRQTTGENITKGTKISQVLYHCIFMG